MTCATVCRSVATFKGRFRVGVAIRPKRLRGVCHVTIRQAGMVRLVSRCNTFRSICVRGMPCGAMAKSATNRLAPKAMTMSVWLMMSRFLLLMLVMVAFLGQSS
jgi:uncharacterized membrane protein